MLEQELKLRVLQTQALDFAGLHLEHFAIEPMPAQAMETQYWDTKCRFLQQHGYALRVRRVADRWLQSVKSRGQVRNGIHERQEWEQPLSAFRLSLDALASTPLADLLEANPKHREALCVQFVTEFCRQRWWLRDQQGAVIEMAYDRGYLVMGTHRALIHEIELERVQGSVQPLYAVAEVLMQRYPLSLSERSKADLADDLPV